MRPQAPEHPAGREGVGQGRGLRDRKVQAVHLLADHKDPRSRHTGVHGTGALLRWPRQREVRRVRAGHDLVGVPNGAGALAGDGVPRPGRHGRLCGEEKTRTARGLPRVSEKDDHEVLAR